jgi:hypothetical protein
VGRRWFRAIAPVGVMLIALAGVARADQPLQVYGLTLDDTKIGDRFCEETGNSGPYECKESPHTLPRIAEIEIREQPTSVAVLTLGADDEKRPDRLQIFYAPRQRAGQAFLIRAVRNSALQLDGARNEVLQSLGAPAREFTHADMEARGLKLFDLTIDTVLYVDPNLPSETRDRMVERLKTKFDPSGVELFQLADTSLPDLARLLGADFRGAIVQIGESGWGHQSIVTTVLIDLSARRLFSI